jgi:hypothetical protein
MVIYFSQCLRTEHVAGKKAGGDKMAAGVKVDPKASGEALSLGSIWIFWFGKLSNPVGGYVGELERLFNTHSIQITQSPLIPAKEAVGLLLDDGEYCGVVVVNSQKPQVLGDYARNFSELIMICPHREGGKCFFRRPLAVDTGGLSSIQYERVMKI